MMELYALARVRCHEKQATKKRRRKLRRFLISNGSPD